MYIIFERHKLGQLISNLRDMVSFNPLLAQRAAHKRKSNTKGGPPMLEKLHNTIGVKYMSTFNLNTRFFT